MTTMREVFYGVISQGVAPYFFLMEEKICSFFGHRDVEITSELIEAAANAIGEAVKDGCRVFYFGGFGDFDGLCYRIVSELQAEDPSLGLRRVFCVPQERYLRKRARYFRAEDYDSVIFLQPAFSGWYKSIYFRNCAMIDASDRVIFYAEKRENSGAYKALRYAEQKADKRAVNLFGIQI